MSETTNTPSSPLSAAEFVTLGLLGAAIAVGSGVLLGDADRRHACGRFLREIVVPQACRVAAATILEAAARAVTGHDSAAHGLGRGITSPRLD